jgi:peptidoglycan/xylan/chitin deacetylase (PgdA/CDA1 family)
MMKIIFYHYIKSSSKDYPFLPYLNINNFRMQLDYFKKSFGFIDKEQFENVFTNNKKNIPSGVVLTFDDWLLDHYEFILPELKKRNLWGIFFVCTG